MAEMKDSKDAASASEPIVTSTGSAGDADHRAHTTNDTNPMGMMCSYGLGVMCCPVTCCASWQILQPNEDLVVLYWGKYHSTIKESGCHWVINWGASTTRVSTKRLTAELPSHTVTDATGAPIVIDAIVTYKVQDSAKAVLSVQNYLQFLLGQSSIVLRQIATRYTYKDLKNDSAHITAEMRDLVQQRVAVAGIQVLSMDLTNLTYAAGMAQTLLVKQQAEATLEARKIIVDGAVKITTDAAQAIEAHGVTLDAAAKAQLVSNLLIVLVGKEGAQPVLSMN